MVRKARIKLTSTNYKKLEGVCDELRAISERSGVKANGPIPLPTRIERYTVLSGPHVDKKARQQFEIRTHKRIIDIVETTSKTIDSLTKLNIPSGVEIDIKL